jgi:hypothetical protein
VRAEAVSTIRHFPRPASTSSSTARVRLPPAHRRPRVFGYLRPGFHLLEDHTVALVLPRPGTGRPRPRTTPLSSCFPTRVASPCTDLLVSFTSSPPPQIASPPLLDPPRTDFLPPRHRPLPELAGRRHQRVVAAPPLLRPWAFRSGLAGPNCQAGLDVEVNASPARS